MLCSMRLRGFVVVLGFRIGMWGREVTSAADIVPTLKEAFEQEGPALIAVPVDYAENMKLTDRLGAVQMQM